MIYTGNKSKVMEITKHLTITSGIPVLRCVRCGKVVDCGRKTCSWTGEGEEKNLITNDEEEKKREKKTRKLQAWCVEK